MLLLLALAGLLAGAIPEVPGKITNDGDERGREQRRQPLQTGAGLIVFRGTSRGHRCAVLRGHGCHHRGGVILIVDVGACCLRQLALGQTLEVIAHLPSRLVAVRRVLGHCSEHDGVDAEPLPFRQIFSDELRGRCGILLHVLVSHRKRCFTFKRRAAGNRFIHDAAQSVDVRAGVGRLAAGLFRREVLRGADHRGGLRHRGRRIIQGAGDAEVHDLHLAGVGQHNVGRLDIAVDDPGLVGRLQGIRHRLEHARGFFDRHGAILTDDVAQGAALHVLHDDIGHHQAVDVLFTRVEDGNDVRVVELAGILGLAAESLAEVDVARHVGAQHLDGDGAPQNGVLGFVHLGHAAGADGLAEVVPITDHGGLLASL